MREPNFKLGWFVPNQVAALTHFHSGVIAEDFMGVVQTGDALLKDVTNDFHVIIDNRVVNMDAPATLAQMKQMVPYMNHDYLRSVVVVKPEQLTLQPENLEIEEVGNTTLKNVNSLQEAVAFLREIVKDISWEAAEVTFFPNIDLSDAVGN